MPAGREALSPGQGLSLGGVHVASMALCVGTSPVLACCGWCISACLACCLSRDPPTCLFHMVQRGSGRAAATHAPCRPGGHAAGRPFLAAAG